jgi:signal transduction histidine kinase
MRQRVQHIGGRMEIHSHKDGTTVRVMIPLE